MKEKFLNLILVIFLGIFLSTLIVAINNKPESNLALAQSPQLDLEFSGKVKVIDGDSIKVDEKEVRLLGIDAPEFKQNCFDKNNQEYACGKVSYIFLKKLADKKIAKCLYHEKDIYNRYLAKCFIDKLSINDEILKNGMAVIYDFTLASKEEIALENFARNNKSGIWQGVFELPKTYRKNNNRY